MKRTNGTSPGPVAPWFSLVQPWLARARGGKKAGLDPSRPLASAHGPDPRCATARPRPSTG